MFRGIEVDKVSDLDRQMQLYLAHRDEVGLDDRPAGRIVEAGLERGTRLCPGRPTLGEKPIQARLLEDFRIASGSTPYSRQVNDLISDCGPDSGCVTVAGDDAIRELGDAEPCRCGRLEPAHVGSTTSPSDTRSATGSRTPQQPKLRNRRRTRATSASVQPVISSARAWLSPCPSSWAASASEAPSIKVSVARRRLRKPCWRGLAGSVSAEAQAWCRPAVALNARSASISTLSCRASWSADGVSAGSRPPVRIFP